MGSVIFKQPNGLYGRYSSVVDEVTNYNMTEEEVIELFAEMAKESAKWELQSLNSNKATMKDGSIKCQGDLMYDRVCEKMDGMYECYEDPSLCHGMPIEEWRRVRKAMESDPEPTEVCVRRD